MIENSERAWINFADQKSNLFDKKLRNSLKIHYICLKTTSTTIKNEMSY